MSKEKFLLLISIIVVHGIGLYMLSHVPSVSTESKDIPIIEVSMVDLSTKMIPPIAKVKVAKVENTQTKPTTQATPVSTASVVTKNIVPVHAAEALIPKEEYTPPSVPVAVQNKPEIHTQQAAVSAPVILSGDLSLSCPVRTPPKYPRLSQKMEEEGSVVVRVKLDKEGKITETSVKTSSGYKRLDDAALSAVQTWQCRPCIRNGGAVEAFALQPFEFTLEGN